MGVQPVTVNLPSSLYERLAHRASKMHRPVEAELVEAVTTSLPHEPDELPGDMAEAIEALHLLDDEALWRAARTSLAPEKAASIEDLHLKRQREGLSASEVETLATWMKEYTRIMLVRARASALLKQRGHDVSTLLSEHEP
jgi:plasmid stability protein